VATPEEQKPVTALKTKKGKQITESSTDIEKPDAASGIENENK
jgi:hypothetical protein